MGYKPVKRPWGTYTVIGRWSGKITVKILSVNPQSRLSLQKHRHRDEEWLCLEGTATVRVGDRTFKVKAGDKAFVPRGALHRIDTRNGVEMLEVSTGKFSERDIVRLDDDYGRATPGGSRSPKPPALPLT